MFSCHGLYLRWTNSLPRTFWTGHRIQWLKWGLFVFGRTRGILVPWWRTEPVPFVLGPQSLNYWNAREVREMKTFKVFSDPSAAHRQGLPATQAFLWQGAALYMALAHFDLPKLDGKHPEGRYFVLFCSPVSPVLRINLNFLRMQITFVSVSKHCVVSSSYQEIRMEKPCVAIHFLGQSRKDVKSLQRFEDDITRLSINIGTV